MSTPAYLNAHELAARWQVKVQTLSAQRHRGEGPPYYKIGWVVRYAMQDVIEYESQNKVTPEKAAQQ